MKRITAIALFALAGALGAGHAFAQVHAVRATMPFGFTVGTKLLPPGTYTITPVSDSVIAIQNRDMHFSMLIPAIPNGKMENSAQLVFDKYAGHYFLRQIIGGPTAMNVDLPVTKSEKKARLQEASVGNQSQVFLAASE